MFFVSSAIVVAVISLVTGPDANTSLFLYDKFFASNKRKSQSFGGKRIWITGASSGIGAELAKQLHSYGAKIILSGRREDELKRVQSSIILDTSENELKANGVSLLPFDVTDTDDRIEEVVSMALGVYNGIDILILNAGSGQLGTAQDSLLSTTRSLLEVNFIGPQRIALELIRQDAWGEYTELSDYTKKKNGHIVVTSSVASKMALPLGTSYAASKHAVHGYFSSLRSEGGEWLRVDLPCPGPIATNFQTKVIGSTSITESSKTKKSRDDEDSSEVAMPADRCAELILSSMMGPSSMMQETWISRQPTLIFMYINQYFPNLSATILGKVGPLRVKAFHAGLPLYKASSWIQAAQMEKEKAKTRIGGAARKIDQNTLDASKKLK
uniref:Uncharacterized protein n=1 Tax=Chaetoceros debilis TaxID=122233 RepID=A0A7S3PTK4_9STRA|mmetsp:Transcript_16597/g.24303  ORF Transcript_16597/g.24303 Transcript_16597/m.24303 type:complete len:384 (+) Transcript_16597:24-1175(+)